LPLRFHFSVGTSVKKPASTARNRYALNLTVLHQAHKMLEGTVIGRFGIFRKAAAGEFPGLQMISQTFATNPFAIAGIIGASALLEVFFFFAVHKSVSLVSIVLL
jgi:hypothetical protein